tara:strand:- start:202 stop:561 length:360 start_codon:yes stop_codon:yes gene_type:complete
MYLIHEYTKEIILQSSKIHDFDFQETKSDGTVAPKFTVTLGVMPDYLFDGIGMRIDGISKGKTAEKYAVQKGDVVLQINEYEVLDMMGYMKALSKFKKGDPAVLKLNRKEEIIEIDIIF